MRTFCIGDRVRFKYGPHEGKVFTVSGYTDMGCTLKEFPHFVGNDELFELVSDEKAADAVNHPAHYTQGSIECIDAIRVATTGLNGFEGYYTGNIMKYLWRWKLKNGVEDLEKAKWYLDRLIQEGKK